MKTQGRVLVVDDDPSVRMMIALTLSQSGFTASAAAAGGEALAMLSREHFDWMITDGKMQPMDGFELSRQAKQIRPGLRILMISAVYNERDIGSYPIERIFIKPASMDRMLAWMKTISQSCLP